MKPMLEFTRLPPKAQEKPRRRRMKLKSPRNPRVRYVALTGFLNRPIRHESCQPDNTNFELAMKGAKWVSPQFPGEHTRGKLCTNGRKSRPHHALKGQLFPEQHRTNIGSDKGLGERRLGDGGCARTRPLEKQQDGCFRARVCTRRGLTHSQDISLYPSMYPLPTLPEDSVRTGDISAVMCDVTQGRRERRSLLVGSGQGEDFLPLCNREQDAGTSGNNPQGREDFEPLRGEGKETAAVGNHMEGRRRSREDAEVGRREEFLKVCGQGRVSGSNLEGSNVGLAGGREDFLPLFNQGQSTDPGISESNLVDGREGFLPLCNQGQSTGPGISENNLVDGREGFSSRGQDAVMPEDNPRRVSPVPFPQCSAAGLRAQEDTLSSGIRDVGSIRGFKGVGDQEDIPSSGNHSVGSMGGLKDVGDQEDTPSSSNRDVGSVRGFKGVGDQEDTPSSGNHECIPDGKVIDQHNSSSHSNVDDLSSLISSMSIDENEHINAGAPVGLDSTHPLDPTHLCNDTGSAHISGNPGAAHLSDDSDATHLSEDSGPTHLLDHTHPTGDTESTHVSGNAHLSDDSDATHLSEDSGPTHLSEDSGPTHLSEDSGPTHLSEGSGSTHLSEDSGPTHLSEGSGSTHLSEDSYSTHLSEGSDSTKLSGDTGNIGHAHPSSLEVCAGKKLQTNPRVKAAETGIKSADSQQCDLEGYVDEFGSDTVELPLCEAAQSPGSVSNPGSDELQTELCGQIGEGRLFQPPSFSTPFRNGVSDSSRFTTGGDWRSNMDACSPGNRSDFAARLESGCVQSQSLSTRLNSSKWRSPGLMESCSTRLESFWGMVHSPMDVGTPSGATPHVQASVKSILKKRHLYWNSQTPRNLSKSVTFKLPPDSDGSVVLAVETPEHLWCAPLGSHAGFRANCMHDTEGFSRLSTEGSLGATGGCSRMSMERSLGHQASLSCSTSATEDCSGVSMERDIGNRTALSCVSTSGAEDCCSRVSMGVSMERDVGNTAGTQGCSRLSMEHSLGNQVPCCLMDRLCTAITPVCVHCNTSDACDCHNHGGGDSSWSAVHTKCLVTSTHNSEPSELEGMSVLAMETPCEYWESVPINFIDNTFNS